MLRALWTALIETPDFRWADLGLPILFGVASAAGHFWRLSRVTSLTNPLAWIYGLGRGLGVGLFWWIVFGLGPAIGRGSDAWWAGIVWCGLASWALLMVPPLAGKAFPRAARGLVDLDGKIADLPDRFGRGDRYPDKPLDFPAPKRAGETS